VEPVHDVPVVPWDDFLPRFRWKQGEHVALVGPTGQGKTTLALQLLPRRDWVTIIATKPKDRTLAGLRSEGYVRIPAWPPPNAETNRVLLWPAWRDESSTKAQARTIHQAIGAIFRAGSWCVFADDVQYLTEHLGLTRTLNTLWLQARSLGISVVAATQRPRHVPLAMWSQSTHVFIWQTADDEDLRRLGGLGGHSSKLIRSIVSELPKHHALYVNNRDRKLAITKAERI
jgi:hypothetical protein